MSEDPKKYGFELEPEQPEIIELDVSNLTEEDLAEIREMVKKLKEKHQK